MTSKRAPREEPVVPFLCGQERAHIFEGLQSYGDAEEMQKSIAGAPHQLSGNGHPLGAWWPLAMTQSLGPCWGTSGGVLLPQHFCSLGTSGVWKEISFFLFLLGWAHLSLQEQSISLLGPALKVSSSCLPFVLNAKVWAKSKF